MGQTFFDKSVKIELTDVFNVKLTLGDGTEYDGVEIRRLFPISNRDHYISFIDKDEHEIGMIRSYDDLSDESSAAVKAIFNDYYLIPKITKVYECNDKNGPLKITADTDHGYTSFTIRNRHNDMKFFDDHKVIIRDADDNRYEIEDIDKLDKKSWLLLTSFL